MQAQFTLTCLNSCFRMWQMDSTRPISNEPNSLGHDNQVAEGAPHTQLEQQSQPGSPHPLGYPSGDALH